MTHGTTRCTHPMLPFAFAGVGASDGYFARYTDCVWLDDFGRWSIGDQCSELVVCYEEGYVIEHGENIPPFRCFIKVVPI